MLIERLPCVQCENQLYSDLKWEVLQGPDEPEDEGEANRLDQLHWERFQVQVESVPLMQFVPSAGNPMVVRGRCPRGHETEVPRSVTHFEWVFDEAVRLTALGFPTAAIVRVASALEEFWRRCLMAVHVNAGQTLDFATAFHRYSTMNLRELERKVVESWDSKAAARRDARARRLGALRNECVHSGREASEAEAIKALSEVREVIREGYWSYIDKDSPGFQIVDLPGVQLSSAGFTRLAEEGMVEPYVLPQADDPHLPDIQQDPPPYQSWLYLDMVQSAHGMESIEEIVDKAKGDLHYRRGTKLTPRSQ